MESVIVSTSHTTVMSKAGKVPQGCIRLLYLFIFHSFKSRDKLEEGSLDRFSPISKSGKLAHTMVLTVYLVVAFWGIVMYLISDKYS